DQVFELLSHQLGTDGPDVLFDIFRSRGSSKGGARARTLLTQPDVRERASPALRIAFDFHVAYCQDRPALFERAGQDGDQRVLLMMEIARGAPCSSKKDPCCFREDPAIRDAINKIKARIGG